MDHSPAVTFLVHPMPQLTQPPQPSQLLPQLPQLSQVHPMPRDGSLPTAVATASVEFSKISLGGSIRRWGWGSSPEGQPAAEEGSHAQVGGAAAARRGSRGGVSWGNSPEGHSAAARRGTQQQWRGLTRRRGSHAQAGFSWSRRGGDGRGGLARTAAVP